MGTYETTIENENGKEIEIIVDFDFEPYERMTHDHPGCDAQVIINEVRTFDGLEIHLIKKQEEFLAEELLDWIDNYDDERWDY